MTTESAPASESESMMELLRPMDLLDLKAFARVRLLRVGLTAEDAGDVVQNAISAVMHGIRDQTHGRHPRRIDVDSHAAFMSYLMGVVNSTVEALKRRHNPLQSLSLENASLAVAEPGMSVSDAVAEHDLAHEFFLRLITRSPSPLLPLAFDWATRWKECDKIPISGRHRRHRQELRVLAVNILKELGEGAVSPKPLLKTNSTGSKRACLADP
jgi:hypothetical protein